MFRTTFALVAALALAASSQAAVIITSDAGVPTTNLPGYTTFTVTASTDNGTQIQGFDFASLPAYGFFGAMNQVNPGGQPTIFNDNNGFFSFVGALPIQDSQFMFTSSTLTIPGGFASESANTLRAVFAKGTPFGTSVPFVQLAIPDAAAGTVVFTGQVQTVPAGGGAPSDNTVTGTIGGPVIPEPASLALCGLAVAGLVGTRRRK